MDRQAHATTVHLCTCSSKSCRPQKNSVASEDEDEGGKDDGGADEEEEEEEGGKRGKKRDIRDERREELEAIRRDKRAYGKTSTAGGHEVILFRSRKLHCSGLASCNMNDMSHLARAVLPSWGLLCVT